MEIFESLIEVQDEDPKKQISGKDELNLAEFPIALLSEKAPKGVRTLEFKDQIFDGSKKRLVKRKLTIEGSETYGLPAAKDDEVILALIQLSKRAGFQDRKVEFTRFELINLLGWANTGQSYARIELSLHRWVSVTLHYENAWWDKTEERWTSGAFHIIDDFELNDSREYSKQLSLLASRISWSDRIFESFVEGHLKNIRYDIYVQFRSAVTKRMYRFLDKRFYHRRTCTFDLHDFAHEHIGLSRSYKDCGKIKEKLSVGVKELEDIGFIEPLPREKRYQHEGKGRWKVTFTRQAEKALPSRRDEANEEQEDSPNPVEKELIERGMTATTAAVLVRDHSSEHIAAKLDVFDWLLAKKDKRIEKSPAGWLVKAIQEDYAAPKGFVSKAEREQREEIAREARRQQEEAARQKREEEAREQKERAAIRTYWESLTAKEQKSLDEAAKAEAGEELAGLTGPLARMAVQIRRETYISRILQDAGKLTV